MTRAGSESGPPLPRIRFPFNRKEPTSRLAESPPAPQARRPESMARPAERAARECSDTTRPRPAQGAAWRGIQPLRTATACTDRMARQRGEPSACSAKTTRRTDGPFGAGATAGPALRRASSAPRRLPTDTGSMRGTKSTREGPSLSTPARTPKMASRDISPAEATSATASVSAWRSPPRCSTWPAPGSSRGCN